MELEQLWSRIKSMEGRTLRTAAQGKAFTILAVNCDPSRKKWVTIQIADSAAGKPDSISRDSIEKAAELKRRNQLIDTASFKHHGIKSRHPSHILAILDAVWP